MSDLKMSDFKTSDLNTSDLSIEFFPPKTPDGVEKLRATRAKLAGQRPK
jgi:methylenetetrahydrofolate reductase (NADPH)